MAKAYDLSLTSDDKLPPDTQPTAETLEEIAKRIAEDPNFDARLTVADKICLRNAIWEALSNERRTKCSAPCCARPSVVTNST